jgi:hypothetical protein
MREIWSKMCIGLQVKHPLFVPDFNGIRIFSRGFRKILQYQTSWKPFQWAPSCSVRTDGRTDMTKLPVAFRNFAKDPQQRRLEFTKITFRSFCIKEIRLPNPRNLLRNRKAPWISLLCSMVLRYHLKVGRVVYSFFFFHWHYSPLWALACRTRSFHFFLSVTNSLHQR